MCRLLSFLLLFFITSIKLQAQQANLDVADILLRLNKLNTLGSVLYIAAHPDDENTRLLSYYSDEKKFRTAYLSMTRGDGGQNLIGTEQGDLLGVIRTQELLAARRIDGAEQFFTRAIDFGYSKNPEETFGIWNKDSILSDVVWTIRKFQPDVIVLRFPTTGEGGHGHHTASAILGLEAFTAAADPTKFSNQLKYVNTWQAKRIFWNMFRVKDEDVKGKADILPVDIGKYNELLGKSYGEMASESRSMHKSQGFGAAKNRGKQNDYIKFLAGDAFEGDEFSGILTTWKRVAGSSDISIKLSEVIENFQAQDPSASIRGLLEVRNLIKQDIKDQYWKNQKLKETEELILACSGFFIEASSETYSVVPGDSLNINANLIFRSNEPSTLLRVHTPGYEMDTTVSLLLSFNEMTGISGKIRIPENEPCTNPYWLEKRNSIGLFNSNDQKMIGIPETAAPLQVQFEIKIGNDTISVLRPVVYKWVDPVRGELYRSIEFLPAVSIHPVNKTNLFSDNRDQDFNISLRANKPDVQGTIQLDLPPGWKAQPLNFPFELKEKNAESKFTFRIFPPKEYGSGTLHASVNIKGKISGKTITRIEHDHIPIQTLVQDAEAELIHMDLSTLPLKVAYIEGAGDNIPQALSQIGYQVKVLDDEMLSQGDLSGYDVIITGIRLYNTNDRMNVYQPKLMEYVKNGGTLLVQYNTSNFLSSLKADLGPYPFKITRDRVTDENAEVRILKPEHKLFNQPNKIQTTDFKDWIQERGLYFAGEFDPKYETLLSMNDQGENPQEGALIYSSYGKGHYIYTGLSFFRELPAGVPGAFRLFVNLISAGYPQHD
ncbi:MAG: PIG-L family deacetylase [Bacteroidetes bacterium]|nr:MAG: PIG-L family deacetylase [Bacteroidota bacterium]